VTGAETGDLAAALVALAGAAAAWLHSLATRAALNAHLKSEAARDGQEGQ
jgi:hypothetical protein